MKPRRVKKSGFILLPVVLAMSLIAAIAFLLNRDNGMNANMVSRQMDTDHARYAAEAGLQAVNAKIQASNCGATAYPVLATPFVNASFGGASYSAYASAATGNTTNLTATGTFNGTSVTLSRNNVYVYQSAPKIYTLQPDATTGIDTYISNSGGLTSLTNYGTANTLNISATEFPLLKFDFSALPVLFPPGSIPTSAILSLASGGTGSGANSVTLHRITDDWAVGSGLFGVSWMLRTVSPLVAWTTPGGDYHPAPIVTVPTVTLTVTNFDITDLVAAWLNGRYANYGVLLRAASGTFSFRSSDNSVVADHPKLTFNYLVPCGVTVYPQDAPPVTPITLSPTADSFNDSGALQANNGAASTIKTYYTPTRENRILMKFDASTIPTTSTVQSATLRMFVSAVGSATANPKTVMVNGVNEVWAEGTGNNTNKNCPSTPSLSTSWSYRTNCTNWANSLHPPNTPQAWTAMTQMPTARTSHMVASVNNKIYAMGGISTTGSYLNKVEEYDPATNTWTTKANMPNARANAAVAVVSGKIYVIGGSDGNAVDKNEVYDPATNTWASKRAMLNARRYMAAATANNKIYVIGGATNTTAVKTNEEYDPATDTWSGKANMPTARMYAAVQGVNGKVYAMGGFNGTLSLANNEVYDPIANSWATKLAMPTATDSMSSAVIGNKIYLISGYQGATMTNAVREYDVLGNAYNSLSNYPVSANESAAAVANGKIYSMGGDNGSYPSGATRNHYQYDPGIATPAAIASDETTLASPLAAGFTGGWIDFDITTLVQGWVTTPAANNGVVIYTDVADQFSVNSSEALSKMPQLIIGYW